jgi:hypothetical protein
MKLKRIGWLGVGVVVALVAALCGMAGVMVLSGTMKPAEGPLVYYPDIVTLGAIWLILALIAGGIAIGTGRRSGLGRRASAGIASRLIAGALAVLFGVLGFTAAASGNVVQLYGRWPFPGVFINPVNGRTLVICRAQSQV